MDFERVLSRFMWICIILKSTSDWLIADSSALTRLRNSTKMRAPSSSTLTSMRLPGRSSLHAASTPDALAAVLRSSCRLPALPS